MVDDLFDEDNTISYWLFELLLSGIAFGAYYISAYISSTQQGISIDNVISKADQYFPMFFGRITASLWFGRSIIGLYMILAIKYGGIRQTDKHDKK